MLPLHSKNQLVLTEESLHFEDSIWRQLHAMEPNKSMCPDPNLVWKISGTSFLHRFQ